MRRLFCTWLPSTLILAGLIQAQTGTPAQPEFTTLKSAFVPGEKNIFYDDFTDMAAGDAPPHFKIRGATPELQASGNLRQLTISRSGSIYPNLTALPKNFTYEAEVKIDAPGRMLIHLILLAKTKQILVSDLLISPGNLDGARKIA